ELLALSRCNRVNIERLA
ncbi:hypothetical protein, partial [Halopiger goleimassiliensis]